MKRLIKSHLPGVLLMVLFSLIMAAGVNAEAQGKAEPSSKALQQRIDFGSAQILGQSIKSGAVYLMHRKKSDIQNMLDVRQHYREEIKEDFDLQKTAIGRKAAKSEQDLK
jgi:hypothetical protein